MAKKAQGKKAQTGKRNKFVISEVPTVEAPNFIMNWTDIKSCLPIDQLTIKRIYWIDKVKGKRLSGQHFHKDSEEEIFVVISGKAKMIINDGSGLRDVPLKKNSIVWVP